MMITDLPLGFKGLLYLSLLLFLQQLLQLMIIKKSDNSSN